MQLVKLRLKSIIEANDFAIAQIKKVVDMLDKPPATIGLNGSNLVQNYRELLQERNTALEELKKISL